jgi:hypothetical protein
MLRTRGCFYCLNAIRRVVANRSSIGHHLMEHESADPCPDCCMRSTAAPVQPLASCRDSTISNHAVTFSSLVWTVVPARCVCMSAYVLLSLSHTLSLLDRDPDSCHTCHSYHRCVLPIFLPLSVTLSLLLILFYPVGRSFDAMGPKTTVENAKKPADWVTLKGTKEETKKEEDAPVSIAERRRRRRTGGN